VEPAQKNYFDSTEAEYFYEETEKTLTFLDPIEHLDYESSDSDEEVDENGKVMNAEDGDDSAEDIMKAAIVQVGQVTTPWELLLDEESQTQYYYNHHTYESSWDKPRDLVVAERRALNDARFKVIKERRKRQRLVDARYNQRIMTKQQSLESKRQKLSSAVHEGFYAPSDVKHAAEVHLMESRVRRQAQLDVAAKYYAKGMIDKAASSLLLARRSGARNLNSLLTLAHAHQVVWNQNFDFHSAFQCNPREELMRPPPTSRQFRKRKQILLTALGAYASALPMSLKDSEEYMSSSQSIISGESGIIIFGPNTDVTASIMLQSAKILNVLGNRPQAPKLVQKLFTQNYIQNASSGTSLMAAILGWGLLKNIGGGANQFAAAKLLWWAADNMETTLAHEIKVQTKKQQLFELFTSNPENAKLISSDTVFINTYPAPFFNLHECNEDAPRALRVACLLVYAQMMVNLDKRADGMVAILDCFSYAYRGDGWTDEEHDTPGSWFNSPATFVAAGIACAEILTEDGMMLAEFCYMQAIMRGDGSLETLLTYATIQFKLGQIDDAVFTLCNALKSHSYYNYTTRALLSAWSSPCKTKFEFEVENADVVIRFFRISLAKIRIKNMKQAAIEQLAKDQENLKRLVEFWKYKGQGWVKRCYLKWVQYWVEEMAEKNAAAKVLQSRCKGVNAKNELRKRKEKKKHVEGLVAMNIAKLLGRSQGKYFMVWKLYMRVVLEEKMSYKLQGFARIVLAKRKMRQKRLIARALGKNLNHLQRLCLKKWFRWTMDLKEGRCACVLQRRWRGLSGRRNYLKEKKKRKRQEELIAMALGKSVEKLVHRVWESWRDDYYFTIQSRAALVMQTRGRGLLGRRKVEKRKKLELQVKEMAFLVMGKNTERLQQRVRKAAWAALYLMLKAILYDKVNPPTRRFAHRSSSPCSSWDSRRRRP